MAAMLTVRDLIKRLVDCDMDAPVKFYSKPEEPNEPEDGIVLNDDTTSEIVDVMEHEDGVLLSCENFED